MNARIFKKINKRAAVELERLGVSSRFGDAVIVPACAVGYDLNFRALSFVYRWEKKSIINNRFRLIGFKGYCDRGEYVDALSTLFRIAYDVDNRLPPRISTKALFKFIKSLHVIPQ